MVESASAPLTAEERYRFKRRKGEAPAPVSLH
jgi:hypothetical protein